MDIRMLSEIRRTEIVMMHHYYEEYADLMVFASAVFLPISCPGCRHSAGVETNSYR